MSDQKITVRVARADDARPVTFSLKPTTSFSKIFDALSDRFGIPPEKFSLHIAAGRKLSRNDTCASAEIEDNELISLVMCQVGGKPVILFSSPVPLRDVTTSITLSSKWTFSGVYPRAACASENASRTIAWAHDVAPRTKNNMLTMAGTGLRVSSLFWEASSDATCRMPLSEGDAFDPRASRMTLSNSLLLGFEECQTYLEQQLRLLSLSDTAATDFMQYWVPSFTEIAEKGQKIALRFVPQIELDAEALLEVTPKPDVLIRIFLLFKGVRTEDWNDWQGVTEQSFDWQRVVGIKDTSPNPELFEVREWGGMQVF